MTNDITSRAHFPAAFRHLFSTVGSHRNEIPSDKVVNHMARHLLPDSRSQIPTLFDCIRDILGAIEPGANREYGAGDILGQAAKYCRVIHQIKMSFDS